VGEVPAHCNGKALEKAHNHAVVNKIAVFYPFYSAKLLLPVHLEVALVVVLVMKTARYWKLCLKGLANKNRRSPYRTNKASLPSHLERQLLQDIENAGGIQCSFSILMHIYNDKQDIYGCPTLEAHKKVQERVPYLRNLPRDEYYHLVATVSI
jgi:hypothetical protein